MTCEPLLFDRLPVFPASLPEDELALLAKLAGCDWPANQELAWEDRPSARRLEKRGLIKISRQKMDPIAIEPDWFAGKLPASGLRQIAGLYTGKEGGEPTKPLTIPVNGIYFDQIAAGTKPEEYRLCTPFWTKRLEGRSYAAVVMTRGYPKGGGIEGETRLTRRWQGYQRKTITHPHFGDAPVEVFAINVSAHLTP